MSNTEEESNVTRVVGIGGRMQHGKDAIADHLVDKYGWVKLGMSDPLADALYTLNPWIAYWVTTKSVSVLGKTRRRFGTHKERRYFQIERYQTIVDRVGYVAAKEIPEVRRMFQVLGTEVGRDMIGEDVWVDIMIKNVRNHLAAAPGVVVTGVRFANEIEAISETLEGELWWVTRPLEHTNSTTSDHRSERNANAADFDRTIRNNGTLEELYEKVDSLLD